ncbi:FtsX-like permease family protein [uncultured Thomasclavelia sp.]|uniref:FtsX-like permease family protein n=1 Tax=uncultured Thomasclavelia sp. TaxID=3025759 RepID=UPI0025D47D04|nr:FtsX-like permease family protein [uncultured Thomasclavelia sp.]
MITFIKKVIAGQKTFYAGLLVILSFLASFEFISVIIYSGAASLNNFIDRFMLQIVSGIVIMISFVLILFVNSYLVEHKTDEFSLILLFGKNTRQVIVYILEQFGLLFLLSYLLGALIGSVWLLIYRQIFTELLTFDSSTIISVYAALFITKIIYVLVLDLGKFLQIKLDIASYMNHVSKTTNYNPFAVFSSGTLVDISKKQIIGANIGGALLVVIGILFLYIGISGIIANNSPAELAFSFAFSLAGELIVINKLIPMLYDLLHNKILLKAKNWIMVLSNLKDVSLAMSMMINLSSLVVPIIVMFLYLQNISVTVQNAMLVIFMALIAGMFLCFIIKFMIYIPSRANVIAMMKALGYNKKNIYWIHIQEMIIFTLLFVLFPIVIYGLVLYQSYLNNMIVYQTFISMLAIYVGLYIIMTVYMIVKYCRLIEEVYNDVKYLNRGE